MSDYIDIVADEMYDLVGHIGFGQYDDLDTYWSSLLDSLKELPTHFGVDFKGATTVGEAIERIANHFDLDAAPLAANAERMEELSDRGSSESIDEEETEELASLVGDFEVQFEAFLKALEPKLSEDE